MQFGTLIGLDGPVIKADNDWRMAASSGGVALIPTFSSFGYFVFVIYYRGEYYVLLPVSKYVSK